MSTTEEPVEMIIVEQSMNDWITCLIFLSISFILNTIIIKTECKNRKSEDIVFLSKWLKIIPLICLGSGYGYNILYFFFLFLHHVQLLVL